MPNTAIYILPDDTKTRKKYVDYSTIQWFIFIYAAVVAESCFLSSDKKEWNIELHVCDGGSDNGKGCLVELMRFNVMPSIDTYLLPPYY